MKLKNLIGKLFPIILAVTLLIFVTFAVLFQNMQMKVWENFVLMEFEKDLTARINYEKEKCEVIARLLLNDDKVMRAFEKKELEKLISEMEKYETLFKNLSVYGIHFHDENVRSFLRTADLQKRGDDLTSFRKDIVIVKETKKPFHSISTGVMGVMIRYITPVISNSTYVGSFEVQVKLDSNFLRKFYGNAIIKNFFDEKGSKINEVFKSSENLEDFSRFFDESKMHSGKAQSFSKDGYIYVSLPIKDFEGKVISAIFKQIDANKVSFFKKLGTVLQIFVSIIAFLIVLLMMKRIGKNTEKRLNHLLGEISKLSEGNLNLEFDLSDLKGNDEISTIANSFLKAVEKLKDILGKINILLAETMKRTSELSTVRDNIVSSAVAISEIKSMGENTEKASIELDKTVQEFAAYLEENSAEIEVTLSRIKDFTNTIEQITQSYTELNSLVGTLTNLAEKITEISDNITVLAINASIETSKQIIDRDGLSRIAEMIMELANSSRTLAKESKISLGDVGKSITSTVLVTEKISKDLKEVRHSLDVITDVTNASTKSVDNLVKISRMTHSSIEELYGGVESLEESYAIIKDEMEKVTKSFNEVIEAMQKLKM